MVGVEQRARTAALRRVLHERQDAAYASDLLFLEQWESQPLPGAAAALRVVQLRRANPRLAAEIRAELARLSVPERAALAARVS